MKNFHLSGRERFFQPDELIVSKTDIKGRITYSNLLFQTLSDYSEAELIGAPHSIVRHPDMPRGVFKLLWDTIQAGREIFAYIVNRSRDGDHYWVFAHVTPSLDEKGGIVGYHSSRRVPRREAIEAIGPLYRSMLEVERGRDDGKQGMEASLATLRDQLSRDKVNYDEFIFSL